MNGNVLRESSLTEKGRFRITISFHVLFAIRVSTELVYSAVHLYTSVAHFKVDSLPHLHWAVSVLAFFKGL